MQIAAILSRPQRVKSFISPLTLLSRLFKPVAYRETTCRGYPEKWPYLPCVSMEGRALLAGYHRCIPDISIDLVA